MNYEGVKIVVKGINNSIRVSDILEKADFKWGDTGLHIRELHSNVIDSIRSIVINYDNYKYIEVYSVDLIVPSTFIIFNFPEDEGKILEHFKLRPSYEPVKLIRE